MNRSLMRRLEKLEERQRQQNNGQVTWEEFLIMYKKRKAQQDSLEQKDSAVDGVGTR